MKSIDAPLAMSLLERLDFFDDVEARQRHRLTETEWEVCRTLPEAKVVSR
jgi:hypothetical protein